MSMSRLSNHLYVVVTAIISLHATPSTFHQAHAGQGSHDFTESRQFRKNLAASKYKDNPHWLSNYTWKPPEKFYGPRKRPAWEVEAVTESKADREQQEHLEQWEKKMRDVSNRQREKWQAYATLEKPERNDIQTVTFRAGKISDDTTTISSTEITSGRPLSNRRNEGEVSKIYETMPDIRDGWNKNVHNGIWGLGVADPVVEGSLTDHPSSSGQKKLVHQPKEETTLSAIVPNGRWGMSVKEAPTEFSKALSRKASGSIFGELRKRDNVRKSKGDEEIHDASDVGVKAGNAAAEPSATRHPEVFPSGRWGMSADLPPREFLREISRRGLAERTVLHRPNTDVHQRAHANTENNPRSRESMLSQIPGISNIVFLQPFPGMTGGPAFTDYFAIYPRILPNVPNYNIAIFHYIVGRSEIPSQAEY